MWLPRPASGVCQTLVLPPSERPPVRSHRCGDRLRHFVEQSAEPGDFTRDPRQDRLLPAAAHRDYRVHLAVRGPPESHDRTAGRKAVPLPFNGVAWPYSWMAIDELSEIVDNIEKLACQPKLSIGGCGPSRSPNARAPVDTLRRKSERRLACHLVALGQRMAHPRALALWWAPFV